MRKTIKLELSLLEADELGVYLGRTIGNIQDRVEDNGEATQAQKRMLDIFPKIIHKVRLTEDEANLVDVILEKRDNSN